MKNITCIDHPIVKHKLSILRNKNTSSQHFRGVMAELTRLIGYEASRNLELREVSLETPLCSTTGEELSSSPVVVSIMRAGNGMLESLLNLMPTAKAGHIGIYRDKFINSTVEYYFRLPKDLEGTDVFLLDPMIATGDTAVACLERLKQCGVRNINLITFLISESSAKRITELFPDVQIYCAEIEKELDLNGYLVPGMGDVGSRLYTDA
jgi:uracil phosphoribosyltransferase